MASNDKGPKKHIWLSYNHIPGGQIVVTHFRDYTLKKRLGEGKTEDVLFSADSQLENFKKSPFVKLKMKGKEIVAGDVLVYPNSVELEGDSNAADKVIAWAKKQGQEPYSSPSEFKGESEKGGARVVDDGTKDRVEKLEKDVAGLKSGQDEILKLLRETKATTRGGASVTGSNS